MKVAVIGAGGMGQYHARSALRTGHQLVGVVCATDSETETAATALGTAVRTLKEILADPDVDGVIVATPTTVHHQMVMAAARSGKHVWCEKPIASTVGEAQEMVGACRDAGVRFDVGHVVRYFPAFARARDVIHQGTLGTPAVVRTSRFNPHPVDGGWMADESISGGPLLDMGIHDFDWLRWTFGEVETVFARQVSGPSYNYAHTVLRFADGTIGFTDVSWSHTTFRTKIEVACTNGLLSHDSQSERPVVVSPRSDVERPAGIIVPTVAVTDDPYTDQLADWLNERPARHTAQDAVAALAIASAAKRSCRSGRPERPEEQ